MIADHVCRHDISFALQSPSEVKKNHFSFSDEPAASTRWLVEQLRVAITKLSEKAIAMLVEDVTRSIKNILAEKPESSQTGMEPFFIIDKLHILANNLY